MANKDYKKEKKSINRKPLPKEKNLCLECGNDAPRYSFICGHCFRANTENAPYCKILLTKRTNFGYRAKSRIIDDVIKFRMRRIQKRNNAL